jgi:head-tail adaptor
VRFPALPRSIFAVDALVVSRPTVSVDVDGNDVSSLAVVPGITRGLYAAPTGADVAEAGQRATRVDAILAFTSGTDIRAGDRVAVRGMTFDVVAVEDARNRVRAHIRRITPP